MTRSKKRKERDVSRRVSATEGERPAARSSSAHNLRETIESVVIAFVLAFLFRTFEAEAFVIPTGSMAPTLQGRHKDVECPECGVRYRVSASSEVDDQVGQMESQLGQAESELAAIQKRLRNAPHGPEREKLASQESAVRGQLRLLRQRIGSHQVVAATCPMCRFRMPVDKETAYSGDRILVNKFVYEFSDPNRWDVVVFKFPGDAKMNYIKRLVGLPNETIRIRGGDLFVQPPAGGSFEIARKSTDKLLAMIQLVHDTDYQPAELVRRNWPFCWQGWPANRGPAAGGWVSHVPDSDGITVRQTFRCDGKSPEPQWLRYQHLMPTQRQWARIRQGPLSPSEVAEIRPQLVTDYYAYNSFAQKERADIADPARLGLHWVGDLVVECDVNVEGSKGELLLDLVEAGKHFGCQIDVATGEAVLSIEGVEPFSPRAETSVQGRGRHTLMFANVDDQLRLWVDDRPVEFDRPTSYDAGLAFGSAGPMRPRASPADLGDLAPAGVGSRGLLATITRLRVLRDIYYIADKNGARHQPITDYDLTRDPLGRPDEESLARHLSDPSKWDRFSRRQVVEFELADDQFFVLGDNSPFSKDGRLWHQDRFGHYVERQLLIGKALFIYWPHSWHRIPGTPIPFPYFPNIADMGFVR